MMNDFRDLVNKEDKIAEESIFGNSTSQFRQLISWLKERQAFELFAKITGTWQDTNEFFKGKGKVLKKFDGTIFSKKLYLLLNEGNIGKDNILIGRRIIEIEPKEPINTLQYIKSLEKRMKYRKTDKDVFEKLKPNTFVLENSLVKDSENQIFFRNQDYNRAISWISSYVNKYEITCHIEGILVGKEKQIPCIITGTIKQIRDEEIFVQLWDAFNPLDPLDDNVKEYLSREWVIQVSQSGLNKVYPKYMLFELGEELTLTKKILSVNDVKVTLGGRVIIHDVNFEINKGEILGIIGESGAGKSTTLKAILGEFPYEGDISVFGIDAQKTKEIAPFIGYVPQDLSRMYQKFNVLENIVAFGRQFGIPDDVLIQRGKSILKDLRIDHVANQNVESLSGGQKRRASIAIAMVHNPRLIFLDEPTSGLDPLARYELWEHLDMINKDYGITLCVISHYLDEIEYCDKAAIFLKGIGFYDFNTPGGLKENLPGKGLALEVTLEDVSIEAVKILRGIEGVNFVIQRGERIRILSELPSQILAQRTMKTLNENKIQIHSIEYKVQIDMVDYFTYVTVTEEERREKKTEEINVDEMRKEMRLKNKKLEDGYGYLDEKNAIKTSSESKENLIDIDKIEKIREKEVEEKLKKETLEKQKQEEMEVKTEIEDSSQTRKEKISHIWDEEKRYTEDLSDGNKIAVVIEDNAKKIVQKIEDIEKSPREKTDAFHNLYQKRNQIDNFKPIYFEIEEYQQFDWLIQEFLPDLQDKINVRYYNE